MKSGVIELYGRKYLYTIGFGYKRISLMVYNFEEKFQFSTRIGNWDEAPAFVRKAKGKI